MAIIVFDPFFSWFLRLSYNLAPSDCASALFYAMMKFAADTPYGSSGKFPNFSNSIVCETFLLSSDVK